MILRFHFLIDDWYLFLGFCEIVYLLYIFNCFVIFYILIYRGLSLCSFNFPRCKKNVNGVDEAKTKCIFNDLANQRLIGPFLHPIKGLTTVNANEVILAPILQSVQTVSAASQC